MQFKSIVRNIGRWRWVRLGLRRRIVNIFFPLENIKRTNFSVPYHGMIYSGNLANAQEWQVYFFGGYELKEVSLLRDLLQSLKTAVVLDIGANLGGHTLAMADLAKSIYAFEPFSPLADQVENKIKQNSLSNVTLNRYGLGNQRVIKEYYLDENSRNSGTGSFLKEHTNANEAAKLELRIGDSCDLKEDVDLIKIDVEGYEAPALIGLSNTLKKSMPFILMEVTESSWNLFEEFGGLTNVVPFSFDIYEVHNPSYSLGVFQRDNYRLVKIDSITPLATSFNVLIVPSSRKSIIDGLS